MSGESVAATVTGPVRFTKVQGLGNDYLYLDGIAEPLPDDLPALARAMSERHFGAGADGIITIETGVTAPVRMRIWNADGSEAQMCGNGLRGLAKLAYERGYVAEPAFGVETGAGLREISVCVEAGRVHSVRADMGEPRWHRGQLPMEGPADEECIDTPLEVGGTVVRITGVSMGNPHAVTFVPDAERAPVQALGPKLERDPVFPERVNVGFAQVLAPDLIRLRVWERGSGETLACGTGACAALVAAARTGRTARQATVRLTGGDLEVEWASNNHVWMTGPTVEVYSGVYAPG